MTTTLTDLRQNIDVPKKGAVIAAPVALTPLAPLIGGPARQLVIDTISGTLILTQEDGALLTLTANHLNALGGVVQHVCTHIQSAACTGILAQR